MLGTSAGKKGSSMLYTVQLLIKIRRQRASLRSERGCVQDDGDETGVFEISAPVGNMTICEQDDGDETGGVEKSAPV